MTGSEHVSSTIVITNSFPFRYGYVTFGDYDATYATVEEMGRHVTDENPGRRTRSRIALTGSVGDPEERSSGDGGSGGDD